MSKKLAERCDRFIRRCNTLHRVSALSRSDFFTQAGYMKGFMQLLFDNENRHYHSESIAASCIATELLKELGNTPILHWGVLAQNELFICAISHAFFESRLDNRAINHKGKAVGIFQFTPSGLGNKKIAGGMRVPHAGEDFDSYRNNFDLRDGYDATDNSYTCVVFARVFKKLHDKKFYKNAFFAMPALNKYSMMYWSPLCGGYINRADLFDSVHMQRMKDLDEIMYLVDAEGYIIPSSLVFRTDGGNVKLFA